MKVKKLLGTLVLFLCAVGFAGCNDDDEGFTQEETRQALFDLKGTYHGNVQVSYYQGSKITEFSDGIAVSRDSLKFNLSLIPIADMVSEQNVAERLREIGEVEVCAGYDFLQRDADLLNFVLFPQEVCILGGYGAPPTIRIVFSQIFGGDAEVDKNFIMFNISPVELWADGNKCESFKQLVYHFSGEYE